MLGSYQAIRAIQLDSAGSTAASGSTGGGGGGLNSGALAGIVIAIVVGE
jgi:hypothetical protein